MSSALVIESLFDPAGPHLVTADDALGIDGERHFDAVPGPLGYLGRRNTGVEPQRDSPASQIVGAPDQRRDGQGWREREGTGVLPQVAV
jgi:hypothetical protein